jgi:HSP20 family protein
MLARWNPFSISLVDPVSVFRPWGFGALEDFFPGDNLAVDLYEADDRLVVKAALPGIQKEDIEVVEQEGFLTIRAKDEVKEEWKESGWSIRKHRYATWQRSLRLPGKVNLDRAQAVLKDGILTITLPKLEPGKKIINRIKVNLPKFKLPGFSKKVKKIRISR